MNIKTPSLAGLMVALAVTGVGVALGGVYLLLGAAWTMIVSGVVAVATALVVDV